MHLPWKTDFPLKFFSTQSASVFVYLHFAPFSKPHQSVIFVLGAKVIPGLAFYAYRKPGKVYHNRWLEKLSTAYHSQIVRLMEKPRRVIVPLLAILLGAGILSYTVGKDFLPPLDEGAIWIQVQLPPGISIEKSKEMGAELRKTLKEFKEVSYVMTQVGRDDEGEEK